MRRFWDDWGAYVVGVPMAIAVGMAVGVLAEAIALDSRGSEPATRRAPPVGRYQFGGAGEGAPLLLDTATGRVWRLVGADAGARWEPLAAEPDTAAVQ
jgi:hypothetical protein